MGRNNQILPRPHIPPTLLEPHAKGPWHLFSGLDAMIRVLFRRVQVWPPVFMSKRLFEVHVKDSVDHGSSLAAAEIYLKMAHMFQSFGFAL